MNSILKNPVGRPREFDEGQVLETVMEVFWRQGYEGTTLSDLLAATGLHKGSLYQAFGDKHSLFIMALKRYVEGVRQEMSGILLGAPTAFEGIRAAMRKAVTMHGEDDCKPGCMALNTLVEQGEKDPDVMQVLEGVYVTRSNMITQSVKACQQEGSIRSDWDAGRIASMIEAMEAGLSVTLKGPVPVDHAYAVLDDLLEVLKAPGS